METITNYLFRGCFFRLLLKINARFLHNTWGLRRTYFSLLVVWYRPNFGFVHEAEVNFRVRFSPALSYVSAFPCTRRDDPERKQRIGQNIPRRMRRAKSGATAAAIVTRRIVAGRSFALPRSTKWLIFVSFGFLDDTSRSAVRPKRLSKVVRRIGFRASRRYRVPRLGSHHGSAEVE